MAVIKGILVNDGGAPARILNLIAGEAISAGEALKVDAAGKFSLSTDNNAPIAGVALTDAAAAEQCSAVTGSGVIVNMICKEDVVMGNALMVDSTAGQLVLCAEDGVGNLTNIAVAYALENSPAAAGLTKVLVL